MKTLSLEVLYKQGDCELVKWKYIDQLLQHIIEKKKRVLIQNLVMLVTQEFVLLLNYFICNTK